jgi:hypothetical protein
MDPFIPAVIKMIDRTLQASTTHADFVHACIVLSLSFQEISAERCWSGRQRHEPVRKERT